MPSSSAAATSASPDRLLTLFTPRQGKLRAIAKGCAQTQRQAQRACRAIRAQRCHDSPRPQPRHIDTGGARSSLIWACAKTSGAAPTPIMSPSCLIASPRDEEEGRRGALPADARDPGADRGGGLIRGWRRATSSCACSIWSASGPSCRECVASRADLLPERQFFSHEEGGVVQPPPPRRR